MDYFFPVLLPDAVVQGKAHQTLTLAGGVPVFPVETAELLSGLGRMKGDVMEYGHDTLLFQMRDKTDPGIQVFYLQVVHMGIVLSI